MQIIVLWIQSKTVASWEVSAALAVQPKAPAVQCKLIATQEASAAPTAYCKATAIPGNLSRPSLQLPWPPCAPPSPLNFTFLLPLMVPALALCEALLGHLSFVTLGRKPHLTSSCLMKGQACLVSSKSKKTVKVSSGAKLWNSEDQKCTDGGWLVGGKLKRPCGCKCR